MFNRRGAGASAPARVRPTDPADERLERPWSGGLPHGYERRRVARGRRRAVGVHAHHGPEQAWNLVDAVGPLVAGRPVVVVAPALGRRPVDAESDDREPGRIAGQGLALERQGVSAPHVELAAEVIALGRL